MLRIRPARSEPPPPSTVEPLLDRVAGWPARAHGAVGHYMTFGGQLLLFVSLAAGVLTLERTCMWQGGLAMFRDHPLSGVGPQDLQPLYERCKPPQATERAGHLHSVPIQIAASRGLVGLIAFVLLYGSLFAAAGRGLRRMAAAGALAAGLRTSVFAMLAGFLVAGLFEWNFGDEEPLYPLHTLVGMPWAAREWGDGKADDSVPHPSAGAAAAANPKDSGRR